MKKLAFVFILTLLTSISFAQTNSVVRQKIALFVPLYLDSAFDGYSYKYDKAFPKFLNPGLEFYQGAQLALDSLQKKGAPLEVFVYDSRSRKTSLAQRLNSPELKDVGMFIANANPSEVKILSADALRRKIPFVSATLPNDANVSNNPYLVVLNSTLRTHCEGIYQYLQKYHRNDRIVLFRKNGVQENQIRDYFMDFSKATSSPPLKIEFIEVGNNFGVNTLTSRLDTTKRNICITGSLDEAFGNNLLQQIASVSDTYPTTIIGMPTWDAFNLSKPEFKNIEIIYTTPFNYNKTSGLGGRITALFEQSIKGRPTDMYYRGYETMLRFALLLLEKKGEMASNLSQTGNYVFTQFDVQPVFLNPAAMTLDYFENKKLYFIKYYNGLRSVVNQ